MAVKHFIFNGAECKLEGKFCIAEDKTAPAALILHPNPMLGGTMNNPIVYKLFHSCIKMGFSVMRYNFRGVGATGPDRNVYIGDMVVDSSLAVDKLINMVPEAEFYCIIGVGSGGRVALEIYMRRPEFEEFVVTGLPANSYDFNFFSCHAKGLIIQGIEDKIAKEEAVYSLYQKLSKQHKSEIEYAPIAGADHFFKSHMDELEGVFIDYMNKKKQKDLETRLDISKKGQYKNKRIVKDMTDITRSMMNQEQDER